MITTSEIAPSPFLVPFVRCYSHREFDTGGMDIHKPFHASHEISITFFFKAKPLRLTDPKTGQVIKTGSNIDISGLGTHYNGEKTFNGAYSFLKFIFDRTGSIKYSEFHPGKLSTKLSMRMRSSIWK